MENSTSNQRSRRTAISGSGSRFNIEQTLKDIDEKILGPDGKKDTGVQLKDDDFLNGFLDGFNETAKEELSHKFWVYFLICSIIISVFLATYYIIFYQFDYNPEY